MRISQDMTDAEMKFIRDSLRAFNLKKAPENSEYKTKEVKLALRDDENQVFGGLIGIMFRACMFIEILWIDESMRGQGYGKDLIMKAEQIAKDEKCHFIHLDTFGFQAPEFYKKYGYEVFGLLDHYVDGVIRYYLKKDL